MLGVSMRQRRTSFWACEHEGRRDGKAADEQKLGQDSHRGWLGSRKEEAGLSRGWL